MVRVIWRYRLKTFDLNISSTNKIYCFIDNNNQKIGQTLFGIPVESADLININKLITEHEIKEIILAINNLSSLQKKISLAETCSNHAL
jgi:FlaA1/EpsC-like NDP-sugar epimerase